jgi:hypothetical protein
LNEDDGAGTGTVASRYQAVHSGISSSSLINRFFNRAGYGARSGERGYAESIGFEAYLEEQLDFANVPDSETDALVSRLRIYHTPMSRLRRADYWRAWMELVSSTLIRGVYTRRHLYEAMVEFWSDHFNIYIDGNSGLMPHMKLVDDRDVIRPHALGTFRDLLYASARSPAMLYYLDNVYNNVWDPGDVAQENYARELLELHTLGVDAGYTQQDVHDVARILSGWGARDWGRRAGEFVFNPRAHDKGAKEVLGHVFPAGRGEDEVYELLDLLVSHPATATFIARKLVRRFVADDPPAGLVSQVAAAYGTDGDIKAMLRVLFLSDEFRDLGTNAKLKRPHAFLLSALRGLDASLVPQNGMFEGLWWQLVLLGQPPYQWSPPNGYPDVAGAWAANLLPRWNFGVVLAFDWMGGMVRIDWAGLRQQIGSPEAAALVDAVADRLLDRALDAGLRDALIAFLEAAPYPQDRIAREREVVAIILSGEHFQWT